MNLIEGFSKLNESDKIHAIAELTSNPSEFKKDVLNHQHQVKSYQLKYSEFAENTISNFYLPFNIATNFVINNQVFHLPMVIEESSVVAAASSAAKFWSKYGGFKAEVVGVEKIGQVHFIWNGDFKKLNSFIKDKTETLISSVDDITSKMKSRGGGIKTIELKELSTEEGKVFQLHVTFITADAMGANFINSVLEQLAITLKYLIESELSFTEQEQECRIIMSILSNYTPGCKVKVSLEAPVEVLNSTFKTLDGTLFTDKFMMAVKIAKADVYRATTHNKGIYNGIDAVVLATGNDFRAIEACGHAYASRKGIYSSLSDCFITKENFKFELKVPLALGSVGGLTSIHPLAKWSMDILGSPGAEKLMQIAAAAGLANNFSAVKALITKGIQDGHMRMHLSNILNSLNANDNEKKRIKALFEDRKVSVSEVQKELDNLRNQ